MHVKPSFGHSGEPPSRSGAAVEVGLALDAVARFATTYCPGVGIVLLEAGGGGALERASLTSYGPPTPFGPDGLQKFRVTPPPDGTTPGPPPPSP